MLAGPPQGRNGKGPRMDELTHRVVLPARWRSATIFASPHSGRAYPLSFLAATRLTRRRIRSSEDAYVDELLHGVADLGVALIAAGVPRAYVDLNRHAGELDPAVVAGAPRGPVNPRVSSGLGVIPRVVAGGQAIYDGKITLEEARARLAAHWHPYHADLASLVRSAQAQFGQAIVIDVHSMPHEVHGAGSHPQAEIILGDRYGASAGAAITDAVEAAFRGAGFTVARNAPFAGAYITQTYGRPARDQHCLQIEIDRSLYMDEARVARHGGFARLRSRLAPVWAALAELGVPDRPVALAAE